MSAPTTTVTASVTTTPAASNYYEFNHYSGQLHDWSMSCISFDNIGYAAVGLVTLVAATVARVFEGAIMGVLNFLLAVKYCICGAAEEVAPPAPAVVTPPTIPTITTATVITNKPRFSKNKKVTGTGVLGGTVGGAATYAAVTALGLTAWPVAAALTAAAAVGTGASYVANQFVKADPQPQQQDASATVTQTSTS